MGSFYILFTISFLVHFFFTLDKRPFLAITNKFKNYEIDEHGESNVPLMRIVWSFFDLFAFLFLRLLFPICFIFGIFATPNWFYFLLIFLFHFKLSIKKKKKEDPLFKKGESIKFEKFAQVLEKERPKTIKFYFKFISVSLLSIFIILNELYFHYYIF